MQDNAVQHTGGTIQNWRGTQRMIHPDFFGEDGGKTPHHSDSEIDDCK